MPLNKDPPAALDDQLISDEATTQENSPRRPSPQKPQVFDTTTNDLSRDPTSQSKISPNPVHQESLRIPGQSAVVSWFNQQRQEAILNHDVASAFIQYDVKPKNTAFIRLRVKVGQTSRRTAKHVYLFIPPDHIQSLSLHDETETPQAGSKTKAAIRRAVGTAGVSCLSFEMRKPCLLVGPKDLDHSAQSNENQSSHFVNMLDTVKQLSLQRTFVLYLPRTTIPNGPLLSLCQAVSSPGLLASDPTLNDINGLYGGRGGEIIRQRSNDAVIPPAHRFEPQDEPTDEGLPPAYENTGPGPPPVFTALDKGTQMSMQFTLKYLSINAMSSSTAASREQAPTNSQLRNTNTCHLLQISGRRYRAAIIYHPRHDHGSHGARLRPDQHASHRYRTPHRRHRVPLDTAGIPVLENPP